MKFNGLKKAGLAVLLVQAVVGPFLLFVCGSLVWFGALSLASLITIITLGTIDCTRSSS
jgi:hypothetical protein